MKGLKSRAVWLGMVVMVLGACQVFATDLPIKPIYQAAFYCIVGALIILIRYDTHDSIADK